jgi:hypothetical protein
MKAKLPPSFFDVAVLSLMHQFIKRAYQNIAIVGSKAYGKILATSH